MGNRTPDLLHARQVLYQLSYGPLGDQGTWGGVGVGTWLWGGAAVWRGAGAPGVLLGRGGLGPEVELGAVLLEALPDGETTEREDGEHEKLLHGEDPFTFDSGQNSNLATARTVANLSLVTGGVTFSPGHRSLHPGATGRS